MSNSTFSGPIRSGTVRDGAPALGAVGALQGYNVGRPVLTQIYTIPFAQMIVTTGSAITAFNLPAGSKILGMDVEVTAALVTATNLALQLGITGTVAKYYSTFNTGATVGKVAAATIETAMQVSATDNIGTADVPILLTAIAATGTATVGSVVVTLRYVQRNADGS
jgi:hypothetical protein